MRVLLGIDGSESSRHAVDYIARHRMMFSQAREITCLYVEAPTPIRAVGAFGADPGMPAIAPIDTTRITQPLIDTLRAAGFTPQLLVREGEPGPEIAQLARDQAFDLVVLGARSRTFLGRRTLGSVANQVLSASDVPVLIVR